MGNNLKSTAVLLLLAALGVASGSTPAAPQQAGAVAGPAVAAPSATTTDHPQQAHRTSLRFLTATDFPPFNSADEDGHLTGFNIDFARAVCVELEVSCDIKAVAWDDLLPGLKHGDGDAAIGATAATPATLTQADFTRRYYFMTAHFAVRKAGAKFEISPVGLESRKIAVVKGSSHEAYLRALFPDSRIVALVGADAARDALLKGDVDALFADGLALAFWTNGTSSKGCCELSGGGYGDQRYFGDGVAIAVHKGDVALTRQIDAAIARIIASSRYEEMLSRYFPVRLF